VLSTSLLASAEVSASLAQSTLHQAIATLAGSASLSASVAVLLAEASSSVKLKAVWGLVLILGAVAGAGALVYQRQRSEPSREPRPPVVVAKTKGPSLHTPDAVKKGETMSVIGQVLDPQGKPLSATQITVLAGIQRLERWIGWSREQKVVGRSETDREGRFRLTVPRTSSLRNWVVHVVAVHAGFGLAWGSFDADADSPTITLRLKSEEIRRGRLLDLQGQPLPDAKLQIVRIQKEDAWWIALDGTRHMEFVWPKPIVTDKNGQFLIRGIGGVATATLLAEHENCSPDRLDLPAGETKTFVLTPARILEGRVLYEDTGKPVPHVEVGAWGVRGKTDENGHYRLNPARGPIREGEEDGLVMAYATEGAPYLNTQKAFHWPKAAIPKATVKHRIDLALPRGVLVRGRVTEKDSGNPVAGSYVIYKAQFDNPNAKRAEAGVQNFNNGRNAVTCGEDGSFQIACLPGAGYLTVEGPAPDYILNENGGYDRLFLGKRGGQPWLSHGFAAVDLRVGDKPTEIGFALTEGVTLRAAASGPDGRQVGDLQVFCKLQTFAASPVQIRGNRVELHGCDAEKEVRVMIFDAKNQWGATVEMSKKRAGDKPMSVRLEPCGSARVRFLDAEGKPLANFYPGLFLELAPKHGDLRAQTDQIFSPFRKSGPHTDEQGYCTLTALIPGATYQFGYTEIDSPFVAKAGEVLKLPDRIIKTRP
jgi:protocatechuate 3,4-dioxygenase beta subunit